MAWVRFLADFDFSPDAFGGRVTMAFKAGMVENVTRECATAAFAASRAVRADRLQLRGNHDGDSDRGR